MCTIKPTFGNNKYYSCYSLWITFIALLLFSSQQTDTFCCSKYKKKLQTASVIFFELSRRLIFHVYHQFYQLLRLKRRWCTKQFCSVFFKYFCKYTKYLIIDHKGNCIWTNGDMSVSKLLFELKVDILLQVLDIKI